MNEDEFACWLEDHGFAEIVSGYGHASGTEIAFELFRQGFTIEKVGD